MSEIAAFQERQRRIFAEGAVAAALRLPSEPRTYEGHPLGNMERATWYAGYKYKSENSN